MTQVRAQRSISQRLWLYHVPVLLYAALIATLSSIPYLSGPRLGNFGADKLIHCIEYGILAWLLLRALSVTESGLGRASLLAVAIVLLAGYAGLDEYLQSFVQGRDSTVADFAADLVGGLVVGLVWWGRQSRKKG